jgi:hypothetical protein
VPDVSVTSQPRSVSVDRSFWKTATTASVWPVTVSFTATRPLRPAVTEYQTGAAASLQSSGSESSQVAPSVVPLASAGMPRRAALAMSSLGGVTKSRNWAVARPWPSSPP